MKLDLTTQMEANYTRMVGKHQFQNCVGKVIITKNASPEMLGILRDSKLKPHTVIG